MSRSKRLLLDCWWWLFGPARPLYILTTAPVGYWSNQAMSKGSLPVPVRWHINFDGSDMMRSGARRAGVAANWDAVINRFEFCLSDAAHAIQVPIAGSCPA